MNISFTTSACFRWMISYGNAARVLTITVQQLLLIVRFGDVGITMLLQQLNPAEGLYILFPLLGCRFYRLRRICEVRSELAIYM